MNSELTLIGVLGAIALGIIFFSLHWVLPGALTLSWFLLTELLWLWAWQTAWQKRDLNRLNADAPLLPQLGWANRLTLLRGYLIALTGGFLFQPQSETWVAWLPGILYGVAAILDRIDGFVARRTQGITLFGSELDIAFDAFGLLVVPVLALSLGRIHGSYLLLSIAFYIFQLALVWRRKRGLAIFPIFPSQLRRALAGFQMGFIAIVLLPCFQQPQAVLCSIGFMLPVLFGFAVDWLVVTGRIKDEQLLYRLNAVAHKLLLPLLRILLALGLIAITRVMDLSAWPILAKVAFSLSLVVGISLVLLGSAGRLGALLIVLALSFYPLTLNAVSILVLFGAIALLLLGTGRFSLWQWDDVWVNRQDGARVED